MKKKEDDIKYIDTFPELLAYVFKKMFGILGNWKKTLSFALLLIAGIGAAVAVKYLMQVLK